MRKLVVGCVLAGVLALSPKSEARLPASPGPLPVIFQAMPKGKVGVASWYGSKHQGKATASGESFDMNRLTAAHRELPLGTTVRVTNLVNLKSIVLRVNDRGPGIDGRLIDVSWAAAKRLGFVNAGLTPVEVEVVSYPKSCLQQGTGPSSSRVN
ncbi:MAG: septal ring lytic transglycosylase RlpA family protein [Acidobacteriia bacterium]|jgi:rare lipoprotein A|nr:septal ring lytic transglycosylase RlpA family protein [Terriglobia bacterium]